MDLGLAGEVAVVVGGAKGIGRAIAEAFARERVRVALVDCDPTTNEAALDVRRHCGSAALGIVADATDYAAMRESVQAVHFAYGRCDHVVYAAAVGSGKYGFPFWNLAPADWERVFQVNVFGAANVAHAYAPTLVQARRGTLLFLASVAGQIGSQTDPPYSASKAALINFAQCAAKDLAAYGVRVNTICPGMVQTSLNRSVWQAWVQRQPPEARLSYEDWAADKIRRVTPLGRWQEPEDIAHLALFLASPLAKNITGQAMNVDGGWVMR
jgi:NAD(P)-dependent dehydrogenase (short-subunit alcohol dehydrogenase family)